MNGRSLGTAVWESFGIALDSIWSHKLRSILTLLGIIIGVASVVAVGGAIEGLGAYVSDRLVSTFGSNTFTLSRIARLNLSAEDWEKINKRNKRIYRDDLRAVRAKCADCVAIAPTLQRRDDAKAGNHTYYDATINGVNSDMLKIQEFDLAQGRFITNIDVEHSRNLAVIGDAISKELFGPLGAVGREIKIGGDSYLVVGVEAESGSFFGQSMDANVYIPYTAYLKQYGSRQSISARIKAQSDAVLDRTQDQVRVIMRARHNLRPGQEDDFDLLASATIQEAIGQITGAIATVVVPITLISLLVGGIVIMNIMLVTVTERTPEIGMRKALGARQSDILLQFLVESSLLAALGGVLGLLMGSAVCAIVRGTTPIPMTVTVNYVLLSLLVSGGIGLIFGVYPALKASRLDPIVALSRE
jgi:putative ABC transport system permease protein